MLGALCSPCCAPAPILCGTDSPYRTMSATVSLSNVRPQTSGLSKLNAAIDWLDLRNATQSSGTIPAPITMPVVLWRDWLSSSNTTRGPDVFTELVPRTYVDGSPAFVSYSVPTVYRAGQPGNCYFRYNATQPGSSYVIRVPATPSVNQGFACPAFQCFFLPALDGLSIGVSGYLTGFCNFWPAGATPPVTPFQFHAREAASRTAGGFAFSSVFSFAGSSVTQSFTDQVAQNVFACNAAGTTYNWLYDITLSITV